MLALHILLEKQLGKAVVSQAKYYNSKYLPREYNGGYHVYLSSKNIDSTRPTKKLDWKYYGPYPIVECIKNVAYRLNLLELMSMHNVFHVLLLKSCDNRRGYVLFLPPIEIDGEEEFKVNKILDSRSHYDKL